VIYKLIVEKEGKNIKEIRRKVLDELKRIDENIARDEFVKGLLELVRMPITDLLSIKDFFKYLISENEDKCFITSKNSIVAKHKDTLKKIHNCRILTTN